MKYIYWTILYLFVCSSGYSQIEIDTCSFIEGGPDKFSNLYTWYTPSEDPNDVLKTNFIQYTKELKSGSFRYTMLLSDIVHSMPDQERGVIIILENGKRITRSNLPIKTGYLGVSRSGFSRWSMTLSFYLNNSEVDLLKANRITDVKLGSYSYENIKNSSLYHGFFKCLVNKTKN